MKNGVLYEGDTMNEIWPKPKELDDQWWWNEGPDVTYKHLTMPTP